MSRRLKRWAFVVLSLACVLVLGCAEPKMRIKATYRVTGDQLEQWRVLGIGGKSLLADGNVLMLTEGKESKGVVLLSPQTYGPDVAVRFKAMPMQYKGVCVVILNASNVATGKPIDIPKNYDGDFNPWQSWKGAIRSYIFAFHTGFHQPYAFVTRNPGFHFLQKAEDQATTQRWYEMEIGCVRGKLWMNIDGHAVLRAADRGAAMPGGHIGLRLRGPGDGSFSCRYKDLEIDEIERAE